MEINELFPEQYSTATKYGMNILIRVRWTNLVNYSWFARNVMAAMLVVKKKIISFRWGLNSIFM